MAMVLAPPPLVGHGLHPHASAMFDVTEAEVAPTVPNALVVTFPARPHRSGRARHAR